MIRTQWPTPEQIGVYLTARGWRFDRQMKQPGAVYVYHQLSESGAPVELFVPYFDPHADAVEDFASSVLAVVETMTVFEHSSAEIVFAEMLASDPAHDPQTPVPVP